MGFFKSMLGANKNLGVVESPDFPCCAIIKVKDGLEIISRAAGGKIEYMVTPEKIEIFELVG